MAKSQISLPLRLYEFLRTADKSAKLQSVMITGDCCQFPSRERCFEIRTMEPGSFSLIKPGNLHALFNVTDEDLTLLMFGGYD